MRETGGSAGHTRKDALPSQKGFSRGRLSRLPKSERVSKGREESERSREEGAAAGEADTGDGGTCLAATHREDLRSFCQRPPWGRDRLLIQLWFRESRYYCRFQRTDQMVPGKLTIGVC